MAHTPCNDKLLVSYKPFNWAEWSLDDPPEKFRNEYGKYQRRWYKNNLKLSQVITSKVWSPISFKKGERAGANYEWSDWCVLDVDNTMTTDEALIEFDGYRFMIATSKSNRPSYNSFKICIPWERRITDANTYTYNLTRLINRLGTDAACKDAARFYWPCREIHTVKLTGKSMEISKPPKKVYSAVYSDKAKGLPRWLERKLRELVAIGGRHNRLFSLGCDLGRMGFEELEAFEVIIKYWNQEGARFGDDEIRRQVENGVRKGRAELGIK